MTMATPYWPTWDTVGARACGLGAATGAAIGGLVGTVMFPLVFTALGALAGGGIGLVAGVINGAVLVATTRRRPTPRAARIASTVTCLFIAVPISLVLNTLPLNRFASPAVLLLPLICAAVGGVLGPIAAFGIRPLDRLPGRRPLADVVRKIIVGGLALGAACGAVTGLIIGLLRWAPTAAFAVVEGALFGCGCGAVAALLVAFAVICVRSTRQ
jgi:hypothetical protein